MAYIYLGERMLKRDGSGLSIKWLMFSTVLLLALFPVAAHADHREVFAGPAFGDPSQTQPMPQEWKKKGIVYDANAASADIVISLNQ